MDSILEFSADLLAGLRTGQAETDLPLSDLAFERLCGALESEGEIDALDRVEYAGTALGKTIRIDGTEGDPRDADGILSVIVFEMFETEEPATIHSADAKRLFGLTCPPVVPHS